MEDLDIIEERDGFRVRLQRDTDAEQPYDDGACPILQITCDYYGHGEAAAFNTQANGFEVAYNRFVQFKSPRDGMEIFKRYLRIFHGTKSFGTYHLRHTGEYGYVAFDTKAWLEEIGVTEENPDIEPVDRASGSLDEVKAWVEGDAWGWIVEKKVRFYRVYVDEEGIELSDDGYIEAETEEDWAEVDSCWGFYGREYAEQAAKEALVDAIDGI